MKSVTFGVVMLCSSERVQCFGVTSPPSFGLKSKPSRKSAEVGLLFYHEGRGDVLLVNVRLSLN
jgi:hypothetical protein